MHYYNFTQNLWCCLSTSYFRAHLIESLLENSNQHYLLLLIHKPSKHYDCLQYHAFEFERNYFCINKNLTNRFLIQIWFHIIPLPIFHDIPGITNHAKPYSTTPTAMHTISHHNACAINETLFSFRIVWISAFESVRPRRRIHRLHTPCDVQRRGCPTVADHPPERLQRGMLSETGTDSFVCNNFSRYFIRIR